VAIPDAPPEVRLIIEGPSRRVTTDGVVRYRVEARDDWGVAALRLEIERPGQSTAQGDAGGGASRTRTVDLLPFDPFAADELGAFRSGGRTERTLSVSELEVAAGDRFILRAVATDNDAREGGKTTRSADETFIVYSEEELLAMLDRDRVEIEERIRSLANRESAIADRLSEVRPGSGGRGRGSLSSGPTGAGRGSNGELSSSDDLREIRP